MTLQAGQLILNGKYCVEALVGQGAFGEVYRATHIELNVPRAVKLLRADAPGVGSTEFNDYRRRYRLEFQVAAKFDHPNIIKVYDLVEEAGALYAVLEYAPNGSVKDLIERQGASGLPVERVVQILLDCAAGLDALHEEDIIHRDVKPANILLGKDSHAKIADLGLAQVSGGEVSQRPLLGSLAPLHPGTPNYRSPEHNSPEPLAPTSDVYSLGCVAFEMLTGQAWKRAMRKVRTARELRNDVPAWLDQVVARMLCSEPGLQVDDANNPRKRFIGMTQAHARIMLEAAEADRKMKLEQAQSYRQAGDGYYNEGDYGQAIASYSKAIELDPNNADYYYSRGVSYVRKKDYDRAIADESKAIELDPNKADYYYSRGVSYHNKGDYDRAIVDYTKAIELDPSNAVYVNNRGNSYYNKGDYDRAIVDYTKAIELDPSNAVYVDNRGNSYSRKQDYDRAIVDYTKAIELDPSNAVYVNNRGNSYSWKKDYDRAIVDCTRAIELDPSNAVYYYSRGVNYLIKGDYDRAVTDYTKAIALDPNNPEYYYWRYLSYGVKNDKLHADADLAKARALGCKG